MPLRKTLPRSAPAQAAPIIPPPPAQTAPRRSRHTRSRRQTDGPPRGITPSAASFASMAVAWPHQIASSEAGAGPSRQAGGRRSGRGEVAGLHVSLRWRRSFNTREPLESWGGTGRSREPRGGAFRRTKGALGPRGGPPRAEEDCSGPAKPRPPASSSWAVCRRPNPDERRPRRGDSSRGAAPSPSPSPSPASRRPLRHASHGPSAALGLRRGAACGLARGRRWDGEAAPCQGPRPTAGA
jgi:hypothetical protein